MPLKVTTSDGKTHEIAEATTISVLQKKTGWVRVKTTNPASVASINMSQVVRIDDTPDKEPRPMKTSAPRGRIDTPRR